MSNPIIMSYITVDMNQKGIAPHFLVKQLDTGRGVEITVTCDGNLVDEVFDETRISIDTLASPFYCSSIADEPVITNLQNGKTIWNIGSDVISEAGIVPCEIRLVKDGDVVSSMIFEIWVEATVNKENATVPKNAVDFIKRSEDAAKRSEAAEQEAFYTLKEVQNAADDADHALNSIKNILGADNTYIFNGGKPSEIPSSSVGVELIVESELNTLSKNPVQNKIIAEKIYNIEESLKKLIDGDYIVETGKSENWTYRKWYSGYAECCGIFNFGFQFTEHEWGNNHYYAALDAVLFPKNLFIEPPVLVATLSERSGGNAFLTKHYPTEANTGTLFVISPTKNDTGVEVSISFIAKGFWKEV